VQTTSAHWDCHAGLGPEAPAVRIVFNDQAAEALSAWSERNVGAMLAVVVNGQALVFARVAGPMGAKLSVCLPQETPLEEAQALARDLRGAK
jgi:preprotein translocase subunit SecD